MDGACQNQAPSSYHYTEYLQKLRITDCILAETARDRIRKTVEDNVFPLHQFITDEERVQLGLEKKSVFLPEMSMDDVTKIMEETSFFPDCQPICGKRLGDMHIDHLVHDAH